MYVRSFPEGLGDSGLLPAHTSHLWVEPAVPTLVLVMRESTAPRMYCSCFLCSIRPPANRLHLGPRFCEGVEAFLLLTRFFCFRPPLTFFLVLVPLF